VYQEVSTAHDDAVLSIVHSKELLRAVQGILDACRSLSPSCDSIAIEAAPKLARSPRTFLASLLVVHHPDFVFDQESAKLHRSVELKKAATRLLSKLEAFTIRLEDSTCTASLESEALWESFLCLNGARLHWHEAFVSWKKEDGRRISSMLLLSYMELRETEMSITDRGQTDNLRPDQALWIQGIRKQQESILLQIKHLLGEAEAVELLRTGQRAPESPAPSPAPSPVIAPVKTPENPKSKAKTDTDKGLKGGFFLNKASPNPKLPRKRPPPSPPASPEVRGRSQEASIDTSQPMQPMMQPESASIQLPSSNWALLEGIMHGDGPVKKEPPSELEVAMKSAMKRAMRARMASEIKDMNFESLRANLLELKEKLIDFIPPQHGMVSEVNDGMDIDSIFKRESILDTQRLVLLLDFLTGKILLLEAPVRNTDTKVWLDCTMKSLSQSDVDLSLLLPPIVEHLFEKMEELRHDIFKAQVEMIRAMVPKEAAQDYQQGQILNALSSGNMSLSRTTLWLEDLASSSPPGLDAPSLVRRGLLRLLDADSILTKEILPETLEEHIGTLNRICNKVQTVVVAEVILLGAKQVLSRHLSDAAALGESLLDVKASITQALSSTKIDGPKLTKLAQEAVSSRMGPGHELSMEELASLKKMVQNAISSIDPVSSLIKRRVLWLLGHPRTSSEVKSREGSNYEDKSIRNTRQSLVLHEEELKGISREIEAVVERLEALFGAVHSQILATMK